MSEAGAGAEILAKYGADKELELKIINFGSATLFSLAIMIFFTILIFDGFFHLLTSPVMLFIFIFVLFSLVYRCITVYSPAA